MLASSWPLCKSSDELFVFYQSNVGFFCEENNALFFFFFGVLFCQFLCYSQNGNDPQEDLAKFGYKLINMKVKF
jgi:hypothetical protein